MSEVQFHGNAFEDLKIKELTGLPKSKYDKLKPNGYTSSFDLIEGIFVDFNGSIKTTGSNTIDCADILKRMKEIEYRLIVGCYSQVENYKVFHTEYEFYITPDDYSKLWGTMTYEKVEEFVTYVKQIPHGREWQKKTLETRKLLQEQTQCNNSLFKINPKVDSKNQRRVQCSLKLDEILKSGIKYTKKEINLTIPSGRRKFNK
jgi:hypothetical protein